MNTFPICKLSAYEIGGGRIASIQKSGRTHRSLASLGCVPSARSFLHPLLPRACYADYSLPRRRSSRVSLPLISGAEELVTNT